MRVALWAPVVVLALGVLACAVKATRAYRAQAAQFHAPRRIPRKPPGLGLEDVVLDSVHGWYAPGHNGAAVVLVHGSPADRMEVLPEATALLQAGFGVLLLDMPGCGESGGAPSWGAATRAAVRGGLDLLVRRAPGTRLGLYGFSMGSCIAAQVAAEDARVGAVALAGAFTDIAAQLAHEYRAWGPISARPAVWAARHEGLAVDELDTLRVIPRLAGRPLLLINGSADHLVPPAMSDVLFAAAGEPKDRLVVPGARHGGYAEVMGEAYLARLVSFYRAALAR